MRTGFKLKSGPIPVEKESMFPLKSVIMKSLSVV